MTDEMSAKIKNHYQKGEGSIQDLARVYNVSVEDVLGVLGLMDVATVETSGDLIDQQEAGPEVTLKTTNIFKTKFTVN